MSSNGYQGPPMADDPQPALNPRDEVITVIQGAVEKVMAIRDITYDVEESPIRLRGELTKPAEEAFYELRPTFEQVGYTPKLSEDEHGVAAIHALPVVFGKEDHGFPTMPVLLFIATVISVFLVGAGSELFVGIVPTLMTRLTGEIPPGINPALLPNDAELREALMLGLAYMGGLLGILGAHEMGHYLVARRYKVDTTPPFFIPLPIGILGTLGAVIAMREPAPNRKVQFDIGVAGPLAGLVICIPVLIVGLMLSEVRSREDVIAEFPPEIYETQIVQETGELPFLQEGNSIAYLAAKLVVFGQILPQGNVDVFIHPVAFAGWAGLLVTALNLIPVGQLDGGHVVYGLFGKRAQKARIPIIVALAVMAFIGSLQGIAGNAGEMVGSLSPEIIASLQQFSDLPLPGWSGWWIWVAMLVFLVRSHAPVLDEITTLDQPRRRLGVAMIVIFVLIFTPRPLIIDPVTVITLAGYTAMRAVRRY